MGAVRGCNTLATMLDIVAYSVKTQPRTAHYFRFFSDEAQTDGPAVAVGGSD